MLNFAKNFLFGPDGGATRAEIHKLTRRTKFSDFLTYQSYDPVTEVYWNDTERDDTLGFMWECTPLAFMGTKTLKTMEGLFRAGLPKGSVLQIILHADPHIDPLVDWFKELKTVRGHLVNNYLEETAQFIARGKTGMAELSNIPLRNFRVFVAVKIPRQNTKKMNGTAPNGAYLVDGRYEHTFGENLVFAKDVKRQIHETLAGAGMNPRNMSPEIFLEWARRLFNTYPEGYPEHNLANYDHGCPIRKQIINSDTIIRDEGEYLKIGGKYFCCTTPKQYAKEVDPLQTNSLFGGIMGLISDADQIKTPFLYSLNIIFEPLANSLHTKCNMVLQQEAVGSFSPSLRRKQAEYLTATDELEKGVLFVKIMPTLWVWSDTEETAKDSVVRVRRMWENNGYMMQQENGILKTLFIASLPMGLYLGDDNLENINRDFVSQAPVVTTLIPNQADFAGAGMPKMLFTGRKGQLAAIDFFDKKAINNNIFIAASSGSGKSFLVNSISFNYHAADAYVRIIDIGGSYKKMSAMLGARYLDFSPGSNMCLNPFTNIRIEREVDETESEFLDFQEGELNSIVGVVAQMAYSNSAVEAPSDIEMNLIRSAVRWAWRKKHNEADADTVYEFLSQFPNVENSGLEDMGQAQEIVSVSKRIAFNIREFTSFGAYGKFFVGPSTFDISKDHFVVLELEHLKPKKELYRVVTLLVINAVTQDLYLSDRSKERLCIFDEAWQFLGEGAMLKDVIAEGYRRARKYRGSFCVITQSILDLRAFGAVGDVIRSNSAWKILLESPDFEQAQHMKLIDYDPFTMDILKSVKSLPPQYSELFFDTPFGKGVLRLAVDPYTYYIYTSNAAEISEIETLTKSGMNYNEAIREMVRRHRTH